VADLFARSSGGCGSPNTITQEVICVLQLRLVHREDGQTMAEYGVVLAVITALVFGSLTLLSTNVGAALTRVAGLVGVGNG
jgi:Flp pilus assembly pilin Flp